MENKFAIVGMGFIYPRHVQAIKALGGVIRMSCDIDESKFPKDHSVLEYWTDWVEMFNHPRFIGVTHVIICTPNYLHDVITREALLRGKKVLCEKPLSINGAEGMRGVNTVLQLRKHPELQNMAKPSRLSVVAKMYRDNKYWKSWKGQETLSGGILYNLGVHYIDLAIFLLENKWQVIEVKKTNKFIDALGYHACVCVEAKVDFDGVPVDFHIEVVDKKEDQGRSVTINEGKEITLSNAENLSYEDLHIEVYKDFLADKGIGLWEAGQSLNLIEDILKWKPN